MPLIVCFGAVLLPSHIYAHFCMITPLLHHGIRSPCGSRRLGSKPSFTLARDDLDWHLHLDRSLLSPWVATTWIDTFFWTAARKLELLHPFTDLGRSLLSIASVGVGSRPSFRRARDNLDRCCLSTCLGATRIEVIFQIGSRWNGSRPSSNLVDTNFLQNMINARHD